MRGYIQEGELFVDNPSAKTSRAAGGRTLIDGFSMVRPHKHPSAGGRHEEGRSKGPICTELAREGASCSSCLALPVLVATACQLRD